MTKITIPNTADLIARLKNAGCEAGCGTMKVCVCAYALDAAARIEALERALDEIIMESTIRNHAIDIARRARTEGGK